MAEASGEDMAEAIAIPFFSCALFVFTHLISERYCDSAVRYLKPSLDPKR